jgi:hypothetical protein
VIDIQLAAYNARDLQGFVATYSREVEVFRPPGAAPVLSGSRSLAEFYAGHRFCHEGLRAEILRRIAVGNVVVDHERVHGLPGGPVEIIATYEVVDGLIRRVWLFAPDAD